MGSLKSVAIAALLAAAPVASALAQNSDQDTQRDYQSGPKVPEASNDRTQAPNGPAASLSEPLSRSNGVITPPRTGDPSVITPPPAGKTPIIAPPGTPGGNPEVQPK